MSQAFHITRTEVTGPKHTTRTYSVVTEEGVVTDTRKTKTMDYAFGLVTGDGKLVGMSESRSNAHKAARKHWTQVMVIPVDKPAAPAPAPAPAPPANLTTWYSHGDGIISRVREWGPFQPVKHEFVDERESTVYQVHQGQDGRMVLLADSVEIVALPRLTTITEALEYVRAEADERRAIA